MPSDGPAALYLLRKLANAPSTSAVEVLFCGDKHRPTAAQPAYAPAMRTARSADGCSRIAGSQPCGGWPSAMTNRPSGSGGLGARVVSKGCQPYLRPLLHNKVPRHGNGFVDLPVACRSPQWEALCAFWRETRSSLRDYTAGRRPEPIIGVCLSGSIRAPRCHADPNRFPGRSRGHRDRTRHAGK
jgi:hypothetical protein